MSKMITLEIHKSIREKGWNYQHMTAIKKSLPFIESKTGKYTHRVRTAALHKHPKDAESHLSVSCWCGYTVLISSKNKGRFLEEPNSRPICATCEGKATGAGVLGAREINGRSVMYKPAGRTL